MPTLRELVTKLGFRVDERGLEIYDKAIGRIYKKTDAMYNNLGRMADSVGKLGMKMSLGLSLPLGIAGASAVMASAQVEKMGVGFEVMLKDGAKAKKLMDDLFKFEAKTPFNLEQVMTFAQQLLIAKEPAETITKQMNMLGEVAAGDVENMKGIVRVLSQIRANGAMMGNDVYQFTNALVPIRAALAKVTGTTEAEIGKMIEKRQITADIVQKALESSALDRPGLMAKQSKTLIGLWSSFQSSLFRFRAALGDMLVEELKLKQVLTGVIKVVNGLAEGFKNLPGWVKKLIVWTGLLAFALGPALIALSLFMKLLPGIRVAMATIKFLGFIANIKTLIPLLWSGAKAMAAMTWQISLIALGIAALIVVAEDIIGYFTGKNATIIPALIKLFDWLKKQLGPIWEQWMSGFRTIAAYFKEVWTGVFEWYKKAIPYDALKRVGAKIHQFGVNAGNAPMPGGAFGGSPAAMAGLGGAPNYNITIGNITTPVVAGTSQQDMVTLKTQAESMIKIGIIEQLKKAVVSDIQSGTYR